MDDIAKLTKYIIDHCVRGVCTCGKCVDAPVKKFQLDVKNKFAGAGFISIKYNGKINKIK